MAFLPSAAWLFAAASFALTSLLGIILAFHWFRYALAPTAASVALVVYTAVSATLLFGMFVSLIVFSVSL